MSAGASPSDAGSATATAAAPAAEPLVVVDDVSMRYGERLIQQGISFDVRPGEALAITGGSGSGKSTLLRHLIGLQPPAAGRIAYRGDDGAMHDLASADRARLRALRRRFGVMFQSGALWSAMTVADNLMLPLALYTSLGRAQRLAQARFKLALVGLAGQEGKMPSELSGGMRKRVAIARALMLDPPLVYLDEPSAGLDPINIARLDELIVQLKNHLGTSVVMVTHEIDSVFAVADRMIFLDADERRLTAIGPPAELAERGPDKVRLFLHHGRDA